MYCSAIPAKVSVYGEDNLQHASQDLRDLSTRIRALKEGWLI